MAGPTGPAAEAVISPHLFSNLALILIRTVGRQAAVACLGPRRTRTLKAWSARSAALWRRRLFANGEAELWGLDEHGVWRPEHYTREWAWISAAYCISLGVLVLFAAFVAFAIWMDHRPV